MYNEINASDIIYKFQPGKLDTCKRNDPVPIYSDIYDKIRTAMDIDKEGYNIYIIDDYSRDKIDNIISFIRGLYKDKGKAHDICCVVMEDEKYPKALVLSAGNGKKLEEKLEKLQNAYLESIDEFYNESDNKEKQDIVDRIQNKRTDAINSLVKKAEEDGFDIKLTENGFTFIPLENGKSMSEKTFDNLESFKKDEIVSKVGKLKIQAQEILEDIKNDEKDELEKIKSLLSKYLEVKISDIKNEYMDELQMDRCAVEFLNYVCSEIEKNVTENYSMSFEQDEEIINGIINKFMINVLIDNSGTEELPVVFEEDPSVNNLLGSIEYENRNGVYTTDVNLIQGGSLLKANEGCIILRANSLLNNQSAYYYLKKCMLSGKVDINYNRGYLEILSLSGLKTEPISIKEKVILIGDYETYELLYNYDEDFRKIFQLRAEYNPIVNLDDNSANLLLSDVYSVCTKNNLMHISDSALKEVVKYLSRKAENRNKVYFDSTELNKILMLTNAKASNRGKTIMDEGDFTDAVYTTELMEKELLEGYSENKMLIDVKGEKVGQINALSIIDTGYMSIGKPLRITCSCSSGEGNIIDVQKESNLSGNIHNKSVNILKGYLNVLIGVYSKLPVDFHLNFEQLYGKIDGDSASVAEALCIISALSKLPIKQNIAVTGSINQFGEVQPIGGVNEKIEGFFKVCKRIDTVQDKGVLIPDRNMDNIVLSNEVESEIEKGRFHIYSMSNMNDAVELLICSKGMTTADVIDEMEKEIKKYYPKSSKK
jgi:lon-related putative ATP-dependent protease